MQLPRRQNDYTTHWLDLPYTLLFSIIEIRNQRKKVKSVAMKELIKENAELKQLLESMGKSMEIMASSSEKQTETIAQLTQTVEQLTQTIAELKEKLNMNSKNSSKPPSSDGHMVL